MFDSIFLIHSELSVCCPRSLDFDSGIIYSKSIFDIYSFCSFLMLENGLYFVVKDILMGFYGKLFVGRFPSLGLFRSFWFYCFWLWLYFDCILRIE